MEQNRLFKELCNPETMRVGWHLAHSDSRDDFVTDPIGNADFAASLDEILKHLVEQVQTNRYRPRHLLDIDIPKSGLSVRPGNVLPIEESSLLHAIVYVLAPHLDKKLDNAVYSFRLYKDYKKRIKKRASLFKKTDVKFPFLKRKTIRAIRPFKSWYELWPDFEIETIKAYTEEGYTHITKTDISAYFENIDLRLLETQIRALLRPDEDKILQVLFRVLEGWTRVTSMGAPIGRGIPQGNEISSFLGNIYLVQLDRTLKKFCESRDAKWYRYMDDVRVFTKSNKDARAVIFVINDALRALHLNLQGSKTEVISGNELKKELDNAETMRVDDAITKIQKLLPLTNENSKQITQHLIPLSDLVSIFRKKFSSKVTSLDPKRNRLFRRLMTLYGMCNRPHFKKSAFVAMSHLPDLRILNKSLSYVSRLDIKTHDETIEKLFCLLESDDLPFPYQAAMVFDAIADLHPQSPKNVASRIRKYALYKKRNWVVVQKAIEAIIVYPYLPRHCYNLSSRYLKFDHPLVRRTACVLLTRSPKEELKDKLDELIYHADPSVNRLALYFMRFVRDFKFAKQELHRMKKSEQSDFSFQRYIPQLYAMAANENEFISKKVNEFVSTYLKTKSAKNSWHRKKLLDYTSKSNT